MLANGGYVGLPSPRALRQLLVHICLTLTPQYYFTARQAEHGENSKIRTCDLRLRRPLLYPSELCPRMNVYGRRVPSFATTDELESNQSVLGVEPISTWRDNRCPRWRRRRDSNPWPLRVTDFQDRLLKPLGHSSITTPKEADFHRSAYHAGGT